MLHTHTAVEVRLSETAFFAKVGPQTNSLATILHFCWNPSQVKSKMQRYIGVRSIFGLSLKLTKKWQRYF